VARALALFDGDLLRLLSQADLALGTLVGATEILPKPDLFLLTATPKYPESLSSICPSFSKSTARSTTVVFRQSARLATGRAG
jgi:hypothetical protein